MNLDQNFVTLSLRETIYLSQFLIPTDHGEVSGGAAILCDVRVEEVSADESLVSVTGQLGQGRALAWQEVPVTHSQ